MRKSMRVTVVAPVAVAIILGVGCSLDLLDPEGVEFSELPSPGEVMGFVVSPGEARDGDVAIAWVMWDREEPAGFNVYRTDGISPYQRVNDELVTRHRYDDGDVDVPSDAQHVYVVTAVDMDGLETEPSEGVIVPAGLSSEEVEGLSPGGDEIDVPVVPTFSWDEVDGAESYCIVLEKPDSGMDPPEWVYRDSTSSFEYGATEGVTYVPPSSWQLEYDTYYTWTIRAFGEDNFAFGAGETGFTTEAVDTLSPDPPTDIVAALYYYEEGDRSWSVALAWFVDEPSGVFGCNVYRRIGSAEFERINEGLVSPDADGIWRFEDDLAGQPYDEHVYCVTVVGSGGESEASPSAIVPVDPAWQYVDGLSPPNDEIGVSLVPTFSWNAVEGAETYVITLREDSWESGNTVWVYRSDGTSFECGETYGITYLPLEGGALVNDTPYSWQIVGVNDGNFVFGASDISVFSTETGVTAP